MSESQKAMLISPVYIYLLVALMAVNIFKLDRNVPAVVVLFMFFLGLFRAVNVGTDHAGYELDFDLFTTFEASKGKLYHDFEKGFLFCIWFFKKFSNNYMIFSALLFIPYYWGMFEFFKKSAAPLYKCLLLFYLSGFYFFGYSAMRQSLAMALILLFLPKLMECKYKKFAAITIAVSILFHHTQVLFLFLIPIHYFVCVKKVPITKKFLLLPLIGSYLSFFGGKVFFQDYLNAIVDFTGFSKYSAYIMGMDGQEVNSNATSTLFTFLAIACLIFKKNVKASLYFVVFVFGVCLFNITSMFGAQSSRISYPFFIFVIVAIPALLQELKGMRRYILTIIIYGVFFVYFVHSFAINNMYNINPYSLVFN